MSIVKISGISTKRRVAVTGLGAVTALGNSMAATWDGIAAGRTPGGRIRRFDASGFETQIAYEVRGFEFDRSFFTRKEMAQVCDHVTFGCHAVVEALTQAGLLGQPLPDPDRAAVCLGVGINNPGLEWYHAALRSKGSGVCPEAVSREPSGSLPHTLARVIARVTGARGGCTTIHTACASSGQALGEAYQMVAYGDADLVVTGGTDSMIHPFHIAGFGLLGALSRRNDDPPTASRPFDAGRDGFVMGEGASILIFEEWERARRRGCQILGEVVGQGTSVSAYRITDLHPEGRGPLESMTTALGDAGISPRDIGYINAHGTSTQLNDRIESATIAKVFGPSAAGLRVSSTKSMTGHMIAAAGAVEFAITVESLRRQILPPSVNIFEVDGRCRIPLTSARASPHSFDYALSNSVGFGGSNSTLIARRHVS